MIARGRVTHEDVFHALHEVATAAAAGADSGLIAQLAVTHCRELLDADGTGLRWLDESADELRLLAKDVRDATYHPGAMPLRGTLVGRAVLEGRTVSSADYQADSGALDWARSAGIASIIVVPLLVGTRAAGALSVFTYTPRSFTDAERQLVELLAAVVGPALESARLAAEKQLESSRLAALHHFAVEAAGELDLVRLAEVASNQAKLALGCDAATVVLWDDDAKVLRTVSSHAGYGLGPTVPENSLAIGPCFRKGEPVVVNDCGKLHGERPIPTPDALACVPLLVDGRAIGVLVVAAGPGVTFARDEVRFLTLLAAQLSPALEAARLNFEVLKSEGRLREAYQVMACGVIHGRPGEAVELNEVALDILGHEAGRMFDAVNPVPIRMWDENGTELDARDHPFIRVARGGGPLRGATNRIAVGKGRPVWIHGDVVPIADEGGTVRSVVASFVDVTSMKQAEDALRRSEALFKEAFENSALGMHLTSVETGQIVQANRALHSILGYERGEIVGMPIEELSRLGNDQQETADRRLLIEGQVERLLHRRNVKTRDGRAVTIEVNVGLVADSAGKPLYTVAQIADVTKQVRVESVLRQEVERMVEIVKAQGEVYEADSDVNSTLEMLAEKARQLTGAEGATVSLLEAGLVVGMASSGQPGSLPPLGASLASTFANAAVTTGETIFTADALKDPRVNHERAGESGVRSLAASPLRHDGQSVGIIQVRSRRRAAFGEREAKTLELFAGLAAAAISRSAMSSAMRESEERISALVASAPMVVYSVDAEARITLMLGKSPLGGPVDRTKYVGRSVHKAFHKRPDFIDGVTRALAGENCVRRGISTSTGREYETHFSSVRDGSGVITGAIAVSLDVTDRVRSERELTESRARLSAVVANAPVITFAIGTDGRVLLAEGAALGRLGLDPAFALGQNVFDIFGGVPGALAHIKRGLRGESYEGVVHLDGFDADFDARYGPLHDAEGRIIGMSGLATDITDRVRMELATRENDAKSRLMAMMNHEVRTPLNSVLGFAELLGSGRGGELNPKQARYVANIEAAGRHLLSLVNDSLDLAKLDAKKMPVVMVDLELAPILEQAIAQLQPLAEARGLQLEADCGAGVIVSADRRRLLQVLWNLASNAIKHSVTGATVRLCAGPVGGLVEIEVVDRGTGIPPDQVEKIFEEFHQVGPSQVEGTGLGLALCRRLVALMGGSIRVESQLGEGSTFTVTLRSETRPSA